MRDIWVALDADRNKNKSNRHRGVCATRISNSKRGDAAHSLLLGLGIQARTYKLPLNAPCLCLYKDGSLNFEDVKAVLREYKVHNADVNVRMENATLDDLIDVVEGNRSFLFIVVLRKSI